MKFCRYFGTDGIRGKIGDSLITPDFIAKFGLVVGRLFVRNGWDTIVVGRDTRASGCLLESALQIGLSSSGITSIFVGIIPTPAVAYLTRIFGAAAGIVISASHNPFYYNGIKLFSSYGKKISVKMEDAIEVELKKYFIFTSSIKIGKVNYILDASSLYIEFCKNTFSKHFNLKNLKIIVDCAHGSVYNIAPNILEELGAKVITIGCHPDGLNINYKCGTTDLVQLIDKVIEEEADIGIAYDGDGDRVMMVDHCGNIIDGDHIIYIIARDRARYCRLKGGVVGTLMSNTGLAYSLHKLGIPFVRSGIGDRCLMETMHSIGWSIGAENSGHIILLDKSTTGDGIIACLQVLLIMVSNSVSLYDLCKNIYLLPQKLVNIYLSKDYCDFLSIPIVRETYKKFQHVLMGRGRMLMRYSSTESCVRVMVEGNNLEEITYLANTMSRVVKSVC